MDSQQEYEMFMGKFLKTICDLRSDFANLSFENQQRFAQEANRYLRGYGYAITLEDLMRNHFR